MPQETEIQTISYGDYLKLTGLLALAAEHNKAVEQIRDAAARVLGLPPDPYGDYGHLSDEVYDRSSDARQLLKRMGIEIDPEEGE